MLPESVKLELERLPGETLAEKLHLARLGLAERPTCGWCGGTVRFYGRRRGHSECCSSSCSEKLRARDGRKSAELARAAETCSKKFGVDNPMKSAGVRERAAATSLERRGVSSYFQTPEARVAARERGLSREHQEKIRASVRARYGVDNASRLPWVRERAKATMLERHGVNNPSKMAGHAERASAAVFERYGVPSAPEIPTCVERRAERLDKELNEMLGTNHAVAPAADGQGWPRVAATCAECGRRYEYALFTARERTKSFGDPCPGCHPPTKSKGELEVLALVESLALGDVLSGDKSVVAPMELDVYVPLKKVAIEYCGLYWHSEAGGKDKSYHRRKLDACRAVDVRLITVFEDEWLFRRSACESAIKNLLGRGAARVGARELSVDLDVPVAEARALCDAEHVQGYGASVRRLGLRGEGGKLMALMSFSRPSASKGSRASGDGEWEISRYCSSGVSGGASRLFAAFQRSERPRRVFTYSDLRWGDGSVYGACGFTRERDTPPGYWYVAGGKRVHRYALRKNALPSDDPSLTEREQRAASGHVRVWDCGHAKWTWRNSDSLVL